MKYYWVKFSNRAKGCVDAANETEALKIAQVHGANPEVIGELPYPALPRLNRLDLSMPSFCFRPNECAGHTSCPHRRSCSS